MTTLEKAKAAIDREPPNSHKWRVGTSCKFINIEDGWGAKLYQHPSIREYTWNLQNIAYNNIKWDKSYKTKSLGTVIIKTAPNQNNRTGILGE